MKCSSYWYNLPIFQRILYKAYKTKLDKRKYLPEVISDKTICFERFLRYVGNIKNKIYDDMSLYFY